MCVSEHGFVGQRHRNTNHLSRVQQQNLIEPIEEHDHPNRNFSKTQVKKIGYHFLMTAFLFLSVGCTLSNCRQESLI